MANDAAWNEGWSLGAGRAQENRARKQAISDEEHASKVQDAANQRLALQTKYATTLDANGKPTEASRALDEALQNNVGVLRDLLHPDKHPGALEKFGHIVTDTLKITNPKDRIKSEASKRANGLAENEKGAQALEAAAPMSPEQAAQTKSKAEWAGSLATLNSANELWNQQNPDATPEEKKAAQYENYRTLVLGDRTASTRANNNPDIKKLTLTDGKDISAQWNPAANGGKGSWQYLGGGEIPQDVLNGAQVSSKPSKLVKGDLIRVKPGQSPTGWVRILYDATDPTKRKYIPATPSRLYMGTESNDVTTDPFGITSTSARTTKPMNQSVVDLAGMTMASPEEYTPSEGETFAPSAPQPSAPLVSPTPQHPRAVATPSAKHTIALPKAGAAQPPTQAPEAKGGAQTRPNPYGSQYPQLNADYHIPDTAKVNPQLREAANQLLDGVDIKEIQVPARDKMAVDAIARQYGWGRGPYTPRELKQMQNANQFLDAVLHSKSFMKALDEGVFQRSKMAEAEKDASKDSLFGTVFHQLAVKNLRPEQQEYLRLRAAMLGTVSGLSSVVRSGRATEATINRLANEIPTVLASANSKDARERIANIKKELQLALEQGVPRPNAPKQQGNSGASNTGGLSSGDVDVDSLRKKMLQHVGGK